jgi:hypothetical protein
VANHCAWPIDTSCCTEFWATLTLDEQERATDFASYILWALTGRQFGECPRVVRPCYRPCNPRTYLTYGVWTDGHGLGDSQQVWIPYVDSGGDWRNCGCAGLCCCGVNCEVWLGEDVVSITEVRINNVVLDNTGGVAYRVDNGHFLVRHDGGCWPECANFDVPPSSTDNTFVVSYMAGAAVPRAGEIAAGELACEYAKMCKGLPCGLPANVSSISRGGTTFELVGAEDLFDNKRTGLANVDRFISAVNPHSLAEGPSVWSPDMPFTRVQTWP